MLDEESITEIIERLEGISSPESEIKNRICVARWLIRLDPSLESVHINLLFVQGFLTGTVLDKRIEISGTISAMTANAHAPLALLKRVHCHFLYV